MRKLTLLAAAAFAATAVPASATVFVCTTPNCAPTDENVLVTTATNQATINGETNNTHASVLFTSTTDGSPPLHGLNGDANGQARVGAFDGLLNNLTFALTGGNTFASATWNLEPLPGNQDNEATLVTITYFDPLTHTTGTISINTNGQNFMGIFGDAGERFLSVGFTASPISTGISDMRQVRLGGVAGPNTQTPLPEPSTWALMLFGFGAAGVAMRRNRRKALLTQAA